VAADWAAVVARPDIDAVDICLPHALHAPVAIAAAEAGKHVLVEKPMATTLTEALAMVQAHSRAGTTLMVAQNQRYAGEHRQLKQLLDDGALGRVFAARADCNQHLSGSLGTGHWFASRALAGGGVVISVAIHKIDLLRYLLGEVRQVASFHTVSGVNPGMDCEDAGVTVLEFETGAVAELFSSFATAVPPIGGVRELFVLHGEFGMVSNVGGWRLHSAVLDGYGDGLKLLDLPAENAFVNEIRHWVECVVNGNEPLSSGRDNLGTMAVIDAIYRAARTRQVVRVATPMEVTAPMERGGHVPDDQY
jgi:predicted dehydrogenase